jgi:hypothetical protein
MHACFLVDIHIESDVAAEQQLCVNQSSDLAFPVATSRNNYAATVIVGVLFFIKV